MTLRASWACSSHPVALHHTENKINSLTLTFEALPRLPFHLCPFLPLLPLFHSFVPIQWHWPWFLTHTSCLRAVEFCLEHSFPRCVQGSTSFRSLPKCHFIREAAFDPQWCNTRVHTLEHTELTVTFTSLVRTHTTWHAIEQLIG